MKEIIKEIGYLEKQLEHLNKRIENIALETRQGKIKQGILYIKLKNINGYTYPVWSVVLYSSKNGKVFSRELGNRLTKKIIRSTFNQKRMQELLYYDRKLQSLLKKRRSAMRGIRQIRYTVKRIKKVLHDGMSPEPL